jgi:stearoyl-CoA desaturase (delta-9 desaturase)
MTKTDFNRYTTAAFMVTFTSLALYAPFCFSWRGLTLFLLAWFIPNHFGVGMGYHRLLTHGGYKVPWLLEYIITTVGCLALQGGPTRWVAIHRLHHAFVDQKGKDPHSPRDGKAWAQWLWMIKPNPGIDEATLIPKYAPDLAKVKFHRWINKFWWTPSLVFGIILFTIDPFLLFWGIFLPVAFGWQVTWMVNSITHIRSRWLGNTRRFDTKDDSTNNWFVAILTFGEGWHNNHHWSPRSVRHGLVWWEIDMNYYSILLLLRLKLAKDLYLAPWPEAIDNTT